MRIPSPKLLNRERLKAAFKTSTSLRFTSEKIGHLLLSRIIIVAIIFLTQASADIARGSTGQYINLDGSIEISSLIRPSNNILKADIGWYKGIADHGYDPGPFEASEKPESQRNWAFFPGWPIFWKLCSLGKANSITGIIASNLLYIIGVIMLSLYLKKSDLSPLLSQGSLYLLASYYPFSYFFSLPLPESLFTALIGLFLVTIPVQCKKTGNNILHFLAGYAAGLTRPTGVFLSIFSLAEIVKLYAYNKKETGALIALICSALSPFLGLGSFMIYLHHRTGDFLAFKHIQVAWGRTSSFLMQGLAKAISPEELAKITHYSNFRIANLFICLLMIYCVYRLARQALIIQGGESLAEGTRISLMALAVYLGLTIISCSSDNQTLLSFSRIAGANTLFFAALAICFKPSSIKMVTPVMALALGAFTALAIVGFDAFAA